MAQSNLAREPSMDEILASIRKIIESNETTGPGLPANDQGPLSDGYYAAERPYLDEQEVEDIHLTIDDTVFSDFDEGAEAHDHRVMPVLAYPAAEPAPVASAAPQVAASSPAPAPTSVPLSLADVAARVRAASERQSLPRDVPARPTAAPPREMTAASPAPMPVETPMRQVTERPPAQAEAEAPLEFRAAAPVAPQPVQPAPAPSAPAPAAPASPATAVVEAQSEATAPGKEISAILSDAVSEQVSRSFGELALAIDSSPRRSFDEIAEDMLRPMLQEWLDDNLPTLVERLVREEIERVARGPRR